MRLPTYDRTDFWLTRAMLFLVAAGVVVFSVAAPLVRWATGGSLRWELGGLGPTEVPDSLRPAVGVSLRGGDAISVRIADAGTGTWLATLLPGVLLSIAVCLATWQVLRVLGNIQRGTPFIATSAASLRLLAVVILLGSVGFALVSGLADDVVAQRALEAGSPGMTFHIPGLSFLGLLLAAALSEAFAQGVRLQRDVEGLV